MATTAALLTAAVARLRAAGSASAPLDAQLLLGYVLGVDRTRLIAYPEAQVGTGQEAAFEALVVRREAGEPVAYLRGIQEFHGLALTVDARVLVPRPETELLVDLAVAEIADRLVTAPRAPGAAPLHVVDVGTGSGAIAVAICATLRRRGMSGEVEVVASDISADAAAVARENAVGHAVADRMGVVIADLLPLAGLTAGLLQVPERFHLVCANLPYIRTAELPGLPAPVRHEPDRALDGGPDGLGVIRRLLAVLPDRVAPGALALLEIGSDQGAGIREAALAILPGWTCDVFADLAGLDRVASLRAPA